MGDTLFLLGSDGGRHGNVYLRDFSWDCDWYWGGGYIKASNEHSHFNQFYKLYGTTEECNLYDGFKSRIIEPALLDKYIWRLCDLMRQFYAFKDAAECFQYGGHYSSFNRNPNEIDKAMAAKINEHIKNVIIPEVHKVFADNARDKEAELTKNAGAGI